MLSRYKTDILLLLLLLLNSLTSYIYIIYKIEVINLYYFYWSLFLFFLVLYFNKNNMLFFIRIFFLGIVGMLVMATKIIDKNAPFGFHMPESQTYGIAILMFLLTNIAIFGSHFGFYFSKRIKVIKKATVEYNNKSLFYILFIILIIFAYMVSLTKTSVIGSGIVYGSPESGGSKMPIDTIPTMANLIMFSLIFVYYKYKNIFRINVNMYKYLLIFGMFFLLFYSELLRGIRLDALNCIFGMLIMYRVYNNENINLTFKYIIIGLLLFMLIQLFGILRAFSADFSDILALYDYITLKFGQIAGGTASGIIFYQGTINDISTTFSGTIYLLQNNILNFHFGSDYFDYILRTPPKFLYPDRPDALAWIFVKEGYTSGGAFFELAEAYLNFGIFGAFIIPFIISTIVGYSYKSFVVNKYSIVSSIIFFAIMSNFLRGILYQTFAFYKSIIVAIILLLIFYFIKYIYKFIIRKGKQINAS